MTDGYKLETVYDFTLPLQSLSLNEYLKYHPYKKKTYKATVKALVYERLRMDGLDLNAVPVEPLSLYAIEWTRNANKSLDWDNMLGGLKPVLDVLCAFNASVNPEGLGLLAGDSVKYMPLCPVLRQVAIKKVELPSLGVRIHRVLRG